MLRLPAKRTKLQNSSSTNTLFTIVRSFFYASILYCSTYMFSYFDFRLLILISLYLKFLILYWGLLAVVIGLYKNGELMKC